MSTYAPFDAKYARTSDLLRLSRFTHMPIIRVIGRLPRKSEFSFAIALPFWGNRFTVVAK